VTPFPVILSAPSGGGKTTIAHRLLEVRDDLGYSVSATTRPPRAGEVDGESYHFLTRVQFDAKVARGEFAEHAIVHGNMYGTLRSEVQRVLSAGKHVVMAIDVQGAEQFFASFPEAVQIFVLPPSGATLLERLRGRGTEDRCTMAQRLRDALVELRMVDRYDYVVVNDVVDRAVAEVSSIVDAESLRRERSTSLAALVTEIAAVLEQELSHLSPELSHARSHA
jgi:guanylate kinase